MAMASGDPATTLTWIGFSPHCDPQNENLIIQASLGLFHLSKECDRSLVGIMQDHHKPLRAGSSLITSTAEHTGEGEGVVSRVQPLLLARVIVVEGAASEVPCRDLWALEVYQVWS